MLVNAGRGGVIDEPAFIEALDSGVLAGVGIDVIRSEREPDLVQHPLVRHARERQNLVISPHTGGVMVEAQTMTPERVLNKLNCYLETIE